MNAFEPTGISEDFAPKESGMDTPDLIAAAQDVLLQGLSLLFELDDRGYAMVANAPFNASIGQHYRHVLEHFQSLVRGRKTAEIDYDARDRNRRLQSEVSYASVATCDILRVLKGYTQEALSRPCKVINSLGYTNREPSTFGSNVSRELAYCAGHAIHHYAIIRLICHEKGFSVPPEFGVAPSTLKNAALAAD